MKIALIQLNAGRDKAKNIDRAVRFVQTAIKAKAKFILLPEVFSFRGPLAGAMSAAVENIPGVSSRPFCDLARRHGTWILLGSVLERIPRNRRAYNTSVLIDPRGRIKARYRKIHLFSAVLGKKNISESKNFHSGRSKVIARLADFSVGMTVCYDLRFPELFRWYGQHGADVLTVPSSFTRQTGQAHWEALLRSRAIENLSYVLAPNQVGKDGKGVATYGNSMVIDPWGRVLARGSSDREEILYAQITRAAIAKARAMLPGINRT